VILRIALGLLTQFGPASLPPRYPPLTPRLARTARRAFTVRFSTVCATRTGRIWKTAPCAKSMCVCMMHAQGAYPSPTTAYTGGGGCVPKSCRERERIAKRCLVRLCSIVGALNGPNAGGADPMPAGRGGGRMLVACARARGRQKSHGTTVTKTKVAKSAGGTSLGHRRTKSEPRPLHPTQQPANSSFTSSK